MIKKIDKDELSEFHSVLRESFRTIAEDLNLTKENAPGHVAFITIDRLLDSMRKGVQLYALYEENKMIGTIALERSSSDPELFFIERLGVLDQYRHKQNGLQLMDFAVKKAKEQGGERISIGIINKNKKLKLWYISYGFIETSCKKFEHLPFEVCFMEKTI